MVNIVVCYKSFLQKMMKLVGMRPEKVEIETGTVMNFWVPSKTTNKKKPPLVLIHGFAGDGILTWQLQVLSSSLRKSYSIYVPDLLFFGGSHTSSNDRSPRFQADCLAKGLKKLMMIKGGGGDNNDHQMRTTKCVVVGFSYGGFVGFQMAEHHPELVAALVVTGSVVALSESISSKSLEKIGFSSWKEFLLPDSVEGVKILLDIGSYNFPWLPNFFYKHFLEVMFKYRKERGELLEALVVRDEDVTNHQFQQKIHILWGSEEKIFDLRVAHDLKERLGGKTELRTVEKAGHLALLERPFAFNKCLKESLTSLAKA